MSLKGKINLSPFHLFGPFKLGFPGWYYGAWILAALVVVYIVWRKYRRYSVRKKLIESLAAHSTALSPFNQLNKDIRLLLRDKGLESKENLGHFVFEMERLFRLFLVRQLTVPALDWSDREILADIKKQHRKVHTEAAGKMAGLFREYKKAHGAKEKLTRVDAEQLLEMSRKVADLVDRSHKEVGP